jgi:hypothetical protein
MPADNGDTYNTLDDPPQVRRLIVCRSDRTPAGIVPYPEHLRLHDNLVTLLTEVLYWSDASRMLSPQKQGRIWPA